MRWKTRRVEQRKKRAVKVEKRSRMAEKEMLRRVELDKMEASGGEAGGAKW